MKHYKLTMAIIIAVIVLGICGLGYFGLKLAGVDLFAAGAPEKKLHTSENGIETWDTGYMREELTSLELVDLMGNGINLGNTMEAYGHTTLGVDAEVSAYETYWGQPVTTQEMMDSMKAAGFDSIRIPIAWTNMMDFESGDYTIDPAYLNRVEEIINYAINNDMYVVINDHWDGGWWGMFGSANQETRDAAMEMYISMWTQIAERYKEYSDYLIFESANEELGNRLNDVDIATDSGTLSDDECYVMNTKINQAFVDTVRGTGDNNETRFLLIAGYGTDITATCDDRFVMPTDTAENKLLISVHYYTPSGYCISPSLSNWGSAKDIREQNSLLEMMTKFTEQGYGVIIGEYAVSLKEDGTIKNNTVDFLSNFLDNCDIYSYCPMLWDCSSLFIRKDLGFFDAEVAALFANRSFSAQANMTKEEIVAAATATLEATSKVAEENQAAADAEAASKSVAWIMYNSSDWSIMYSVGDIYDPTAKTDGVVASDVEITGPGTYTVSLDFTGTSAGAANSVVFSALAISNGEVHYPGYVATIKEILINGEPYAMTGKTYTASDDGICTRVNIFNDWVTQIPEEARTIDGNVTGLTPSVVDAATLGDVQTITVTFDYGPVE